jgi:ATP-dependent RNA helicase RhlB
VESENYVHRIGRTARAGKTGKAITLASEQDVYELPDIEKYIGKKIPALIAGEELYAGDKSAGLRIRTEFAGGGIFGGRDESGRSGRGGRDRRGGRSEGGPGFREPEANKHGDHAEARRRPERRGHPSGPRDRARRFEEGDRPPSGPGPGQGPGAASGASEDLSKLPFEQRMAYYQKKYQDPRSPGGEGQEGRTGKERSRRAPARKAPASENARPPAPGQAPGREARPGAPARPRNDKAAGRGQGPRGNRGAPGKAPAGAGTSGKSQRPAQPGPAVNTAPPPAAGPRQGILGKLLSIFKRKED